MNSLEANTMIQGLITLNKDELHIEDTISKLKEIREKARFEQDPAIVKICRLCYEYLDENQNFDLGYVEEEEIGDMSDFEYLMELMIRSNLEVNRVEIKEIRNKLLAELY